MLDKQLQNVKACHPGTTAVCAFIGKDNITIANLGDSRAILIADKIIFETKDHKPNDDIEKRRIKAAGHLVFKNRVDYKLAVSRAFGNVCFKIEDDEVIKKAKIMAVDRIPDVTEIGRSTNHRFLAIVSDGVTDALKCAKVTIDKIIDEQLRITSDLEKVSIAILNFCQSQSLNICDNMTLILIALKKLDIEVDEASVEADKKFEEEIKTETLKLLEQKNFEKLGLDATIPIYNALVDKFGSTKLAYKTDFIYDIVKAYVEDKNFEKEIKTETLKLLEQKNFEELGLDANIPIYNALVDKFGSTKL